MAKLPFTAEQYAMICMRRSAIASAAITLAAGLVAMKFLTPAATLALPIVFILSFILIIAFHFRIPDGYIARRRKEIDKEVLFSGRYLLVKMESGFPLFNSLIDASRSRNISAMYFREIVDDINTGTPIEMAIQNMLENSPSEKLRKILWQVINSLKSGADVTESLKSTLRTIANQQMIEIKAYGKKLNSLMLFYMVFACIVPSIGVAMFIILASFLNLEISKIHFAIALFGLCVLQYFFIMMVNSARPTVEL